MSSSTPSNPARPPPGLRLCALSEIAEPGAKGFRFRVDSRLFAGFVVRRGEVVLGYVDSCPHAGWPLGVLDERYDRVDDLTRARHVPSSQLVGTPERLTIDVNHLTDLGVQVVGRLSGLRDGVAQFSGSLANQCPLADLKMNRLLATIDEWAQRVGLDGDVDSPHRFEPTHTAPSPTLATNLNRGEIRTIVWACGYRPDYSWVSLPVLDRHQRIRHDGGVVTDAPGVYLLGTRFLRRRRSMFINGAEHDTLELSAHLCRYLEGKRKPMTRVVMDSTASPATVRPTEVGGARCCSRTA